MLDLNPVNFLLVFVVAVILLGPDKLPQVARQLGVGWRKLQAFREQVDHEIRQSIPDLPSSQEIARFARSPVALLNQLAEMPARDSDELVADPGVAPAAGGDAWPEDAAAGYPERTAPVDRPGTSTAGAALPPVPDDPTMN